MNAITLVRPLGNGTMILRRASILRWLRATPVRAWAAILGVPLFGKLLGANLLLVTAAVGTHFAIAPGSMATPLAITLGLSFIVTMLLVGVALRPIAALEATAEQVSQGDFEARVPPSMVADRQIVRLSSTVNRLLDRVRADRARIQYLAGRSVRARDIERESVARELRESLAQSVSAIALQLAAVRAVNSDAAVDAQLDLMREKLQKVTDEMRSVAETLYPGTLDEFGLGNAIEALARRVARRSGISIETDLEGFRARVSPRTASALYRVADEALRNIEQHANARRVRIVLSSNGGVTLDIEDDGRGVDMKLNDPLQAGLGLFSAKTVIALVGGEVNVSSAPARGTRVVAQAPAEETS